MSTTTWLPVALFGALALIMFGLGLSLQVEDFARLKRHPRAVALALLLQAVLLPLACFGIVRAFDLPPAYGIGLMLLAATPGGASANLFSHLFGGNVAMNLSLTAANTVLSAVTLPLIVNWSIEALAASGQVVPLQWRKAAEVVAVLLVPAAIGMVVRHRRPGFALRMERPMKILSALLLAAFAFIAIAREWTALTQSFGDIGPPVLLFNLLSLLSGYGLARVIGLDKPLAVAIGFEIGIHGSATALYIALSVLQSFPMALPAAVYSVVMYFTGVMFGFWFARSPREARAPAPAPGPVIGS